MVLIFEQDSMAPPKKANQFINSGLKAIELSSMGNITLTHREFLQYTAGSALARAPLLAFARKQGGTTYKEL